MNKTISILVSGKVQGVYYRQSTKTKALELGLTGVVKNLPDGRVQVIATGTPDKLAALQAWCRQGPSRAIVNDLEIEDIHPQVFAHFTIQH
jgi:acylphosphatase